MPQGLYDDTFSIYGTLHVLPGCGDAYRAAGYWKEFTIVEDAEDQTEVENISSAENKGKGIVYDVNGRKVQNVVPGQIYIQDGKKILMK